MLSPLSDHLFGVQPSFDPSDPLGSTLSSSHLSFQPQFAVPQQLLEISPKGLDF